MTKRAAPGRPPLEYTSATGRDPVSEALVTLISGLKPDARLPSERELATTLKVSRTALRDRLTVLEALGVLRRRSGSGTYVQALDSTNLTLALYLAISVSSLSLEALHSVRQGLERQAARRRRLGDPVLIAHMRKAVMAMEDSTDAHELELADIDFHRTLFQAAANPALSFFADALGGVLRRDVSKRRLRMQPLPDDHQMMVKLHNAVLESIQSSDAEAAMRAIDAHFDTIDRLP